MFPEHSIPVTTNQGINTATLIKRPHFTHPERDTEAAQARLQDGLHILLEAEAQHHICFVQDDKLDLRIKQQPRCYWPCTLQLSAS